MEDHSELSPKAEAFLQRWPMWFGLILLVMATIIGIPLARHAQVLAGIEARGGYVRTEPGPLREMLPDEWEEWLQNKVNTDWVQQLERVTVVNLRDTQTYDTDLIHLKAMTSLERLDLNSTQVSDAGLIHLKAMTNLKWLVLGNTQVSDAGLIHLKATSLEGLNLNNTQVSDAGLIHLKSMTSLKRLDLRDTQVSDAGVKQLQAALPVCYIIH